jgi:nucleoside-diphosphate-sugar epimerase
MENLSGVRILVTGASGFLGSHVVPALGARGAVLYPVSLANYDIRNESEVLMAVLQSRPEVIVHLAAPPSGLTPAIRFRETLQMGLHVAHAAAATGARLIFPLSDAVYPPGKEPALEEEVMEAPGGMPADSQVRASRAIAQLIEEYRTSTLLSALGLVFPLLYGPGDERSSLAEAAYGLRARMKGDKEIGLPKMSFRLLHATDAVCAIAYACRKRDLEGIMNIPGVLVEAADLTDHLLRGFGVPPGKRTKPGKPVHPALPVQREMSGVKAEKLLPWTARIDPATGLAEYAAWLDEKCFRVRPQPSLPGKETP